MQAKFSITRVLTPADAQRMRVVRNRVRQFLPGQEETDALIQGVWWEQLDRAKNIASLAYENDQLAGYSLIEHRPDGAWLTGAILSPFRRKKYGTVLFTDMIMYVRRQDPSAPKTPIMLEVFVDNAPARALFAKLGFYAYKMLPKTPTEAHPMREIWRWNPNHPV